MCRRLIVIIMFQIIKSWIFSKAFHDGLHGGRTLLIQGRGKDDFIGKTTTSTFRTKYFEQTSW